MSKLKLSEQERAIIIGIASSTDKAVELRRSQALLWLDEGESVEEVSERLLISRQTVYNWVSHFQASKNKEIRLRLTYAERSGRPKTAKGIIDPLIDEVIDNDPRQYGYRVTVWTASLLKQYLHDKHSIDVSKRSIHLAIDRLNIRWKRPRYQLELRSDTWQQAKGGSKEVSKSGKEPLF